VIINRTELPFESLFTKMPNAWARDETLSRRARGLLVEILSHKPGWVIDMGSLQRGGPEGRDALYGAVRELVEAGYLVRDQSREGGRFGEIEYTVNDPATASGLSGSGTASWETAYGKTVSGKSAPYKKTSYKKTNEKKTTKKDGKSARAASAPATEDQVVFRRDCHLLLHGEVPLASDEAHWRSMDRDALSEDIREYWSEIEQGRLDLGGSLTSAVVAALSPRAIAFLHREGLVA